MKQANQNYARYQEQKAILEGLFMKAEAVLAGIEAGDDLAALKILQANFLSESFKVMVAGRFNAGKSTFVNALLSAAILPVKALPTTAIITLIRQGSAEGAQLFFKFPQPGRDGEVIPPDVFAHLQKFNGKAAPPLGIPINELSKYLVIYKPGDKKNRSLAGNPYEKAEITGHFKICSNCVEIIDSPGLDEDGSRDQIALDFLQKADAVIYLVNQGTLGSATDLDFIDKHILRLGHEHIIFIVTCIDQLGDEDRNDKISFGYEVLAPKTKFGTNGVFFLDAAGALKARLSNDSAAEKLSGILPAEDLLSDFLTHQKGKIKIGQPAKGLMSLVQETINRTLPAKRSANEKDFTKAENEYQTLKEAHAKLEPLRDLIVNGLTLRIENASHDIRNAVNAHLEEIIAKTPEWIAGIEVAAKPNLVELKSSLVDIAKEVSEKYKSLVEMHHAKWASEVMAPLINAKKESIYLEYKAPFNLFYAGLKAVQTGGDGDQIKDPSWEDLINSSFSKTPGLDGTDDDFISVLISTLVGPIGLAVGLFIVGFSILIIPLIALFVFWLNTGAAGQVTNKIKSMVTNRIVAELRSNIPGQSEKMFTLILSGFREWLVQTDKRLSGAIESLSLKAAGSLQEKQKTEKSMNTENGRITHAEDSLRRIHDEANDLRISLG